ncbi:MAG: hypothetical protein NW220_18030 [Leptolyngbyaceae cyanobacterium bins.349]|nr:hypothetical protein [Leptolyngbyaceae cyanobacterium bins.349]
MKFINVYAAMRRGYLINAIAINAIAIDADSKVEHGRTILSRIKR